MIEIDRRHFLLSGAALGCSALGTTTLLSATAAAAAEAGLGEIAAKKGILFGSWVRGSDIDKDRALTETVKRECKVVVSAMEMFWDMNTPRPGAMNYAKADAMIAWCEANRLKVRGHNLLWYKRTPVWWKQITDLKEARQQVIDHISETCRHFAGRVHSWDVVNEALRPKDKRPDGLRRPILLERFGQDYLAWSFQTAREADPKAQLVYNEANFEYELPDQIARRKAMLGLLDWFKAKNVPVDAIGVQSHLRTEWQPKFDAKAYSTFLKEISDRGVEIVISEMDVVDRGAPGEIKARDAEVAATYKTFLDVALENPAVKTVITWGLSDKDSWIVRGQEESFVRPDGLTPRPLLFDKEYHPKAAYAAMAEAFRAAPSRD